ncbi:TetR/AcrR family transcriptional regulator [Photobacterium sp. OFAV2-7]|uniref:TetR/AcrR family transcriptional regulator n=1 Tax=Photobacterium sp. OFAV2-7 TaxID=2917748 RepID=UPI001EF67BFF|nr:TetR/AcrR family transcriptional regulator [Photobacterium sp. OFAV2-7]MCG7587032.1 TetR/AcrR family transcriptional regulator [Photobacterium sp. OFAV2-7]
MSEIKECEFKLASELLKVFSQYGFQKASMQDLAKAAGVSRQSIYKKFGSKDKCYEWVLYTYLANMYSRIFVRLDSDTKEPKQTLIDVFDILIGEAIEIISNPHGTAVLDDTLKATHTSSEDWPLRFRARLADYLTRHGLVPKSNALGIAYTLISAGKGLLLEESTRGDYTENMTFIIDSVTKAETQ